MAIKCLFPLPNPLVDGEAYQRGVTQFECGACPECLKRRASRIMVRDYHESFSHAFNSMITLTYDTAVYDASGRKTGEIVSDKKVDVRDVQLFLKRLRAYLWRHYGVRIKYRLSAEYGKRTHRPHYHALIFGFNFPDAVFYKKSKRGNIIYMSSVLNKLWKHGICTVDSKRVTPSIARYCSKYVSKDHNASDTFSICSNGLGMEMMMKKFNGLYYIIEGVRYPVPRVVWQRYIEELYSGGILPFTTKYRKDDRENDVLRANYRFIRDADPTYQRYLAYWQRYSEQHPIRMSARDRMFTLPFNKYAAYRDHAKEVFERRSRNIPAIAPRSNCRSAYNRWLFERRLEPRSKFVSSDLFEEIQRHLPEGSRLYRASDTLTPRERYLRVRGVKVFEDNGEKSPFFYKKQLTFFDESLDKIE